MDTQINKLNARCYLLLLSVFQNIASAKAVMDYTEVSLDTTTYLTSKQQNHVF